jgi:hypothetical protein
MQKYLTGKKQNLEYFRECITVNREIFAALKVGEFAFFQSAVDKIPRLLQKFNG